VHLVVVSVNVIWVTSQGPCGERVHQFQMFAILQYVVKLAKAHNFVAPLLGNRRWHGK